MPNCIKNLLDPNADVTGEDQTIDNRFRNNLIDWDEILDVVKSLGDLSGSCNEFSSWKESVDMIFRLHDAVKGAPKYFVILNTSRDKIKGSVDAAL